MARRRISRFTRGASTESTVSGGGASSEAGIVDYIAGHCDGRTVTSSTGTTYTLGTASILALTTSHQVLPGSSIAYTPPSGATSVLYRFFFNNTYIDYDMIPHFAVQLDGTQINVARWTSRDRGYSSYNRPFQFRCLEAHIQIGDTNDVANAKVNGWSSSKTIRCTGREYSSSYESQVNYMHYWDRAGNTGIQYPQLFIIAYKN